tara:strand:- start:132 stop:266 length:135 start_codon:yes stop_codon:yes gene_type:complete
MVIKEEDIENANVEEHGEKEVVNQNLNMASVAEASVAEASVAEI